MSLPGDILAVEPDTTSLCQAFWPEYNHFWDLLSQGEFTLATEALLAGSWTDNHLISHLDELKKLETLVL